MTAKAVVFALVILAAVPLMWDAPAKAAIGDGTDNYEQALDAAEHNDFAGAAAQLQRLLRTSPDHLPARILLGEVLLSLGDAQQAEAELRQALSAGGDPQLILVALAHAYFLQGKTLDVLDDINTTSQDPTLAADVSNLRGYAYLERSRLTEARAAFQKAGELAPSSPTAWVGMARAALAENDAKTAADFAERAFSVGVNGSVWRLRGDIAAQSGRDSDAIAAYGQAIDLAWGDVQARTARASLLIAAGRLDEATADINVVREIIPWDLEAVYLNALILAKQGQAQEAMALLAQCERNFSHMRPEAVSNDRTVLRMAGLIYYALGNFSRAADYFERLVAISPSDASALVLLARSRMQTGEYAAAIDRLRSALTIDESDARTHDLLGTVYLLRGENDLAIEQLEMAASSPRAAELVPGSDLRLGLGLLEASRTADAMQAFTRAYQDRRQDLPSTLLLTIGTMQAGDFSAAVDLAGKAVSLAPDSAYVRHIAAIANINAGRYEDAEAQLEQALRIDDHFVPAIIETARLAARNGDHAAARKAYEKALTMDRSNPAAMTELADLAVLDGKTDEAGNWLQNARDENPNDTSVWARSITFAIASGNLDDAVTMGHDFLRRNPSSIAIRNLLALQLWKGNRLDDAVSEYEDLLEVSLDRAGILYRIGLIREEMRHLQDAINPYRRALAWMPANEILWEKVIVLEAQTGDLKEATRLLGEYKAQGGHSNLAVLTGKVYLAAKQYDQSLAAFRTAEKQAPESADVAVGIFHALQALGRRDEALGSLATWLKTHHDEGVQTTLARAYADASKLDDAIRLEEDTLSRDAKSVPTLNNLALLSLLKGDRSAARSYADQARTLAPEHPAVLDTYGWILVNDDAAEQGLAILREAQARAADSPRVHFHMAVALQRLGRREEARSELHSALDTGEDFPERDEAMKLMSELGGR